MLSRISPQLSRAAVIQDEACFSMASSGLSALTGLRLARTCFAIGLIADMNGFRSEKSSKRSRFGCMARIASAIGSVTEARTQGSAKVR